MAHDHDHGHEHATLTAAPEVARLLRLIIGAVILATVIGLVVWRPEGGVTLPAGVEGQGDRVDATVLEGVPVECAGVDFGTTAQCQEVRFEITSGPNAGSTGSFQMMPDEAQTTTPTFSEGDRIVVNEFARGDTGEIAHTFADYQRSRPLVLLLVLFVVVVLALGRFHGLRALGGLVVSGVVLFAYVFPALLDGQPPLPVALVGASVIAIAALYLAHGVTDTTTVALLGTFAALGVTGTLAALFTSAANITGMASEDQIFLLVSAEGIDLRGLVLAGVVLGSLGVLDDVTVTQVSAVARLREANPDYGVRELYSRGVRIGRDHIASVVNTLVLAYAGAALPLLLFYSNVGVGLSEAVTSEIIAVEVIRTLVGSIGLVAAVPITTALAAVVVTGTGLPTRSGARDAPPPTEPGPRRRPPDVDEPGPSWDDFAPDG